MVILFPWISGIPIEKFAGGMIDASARQFQRIDESFDLPLLDPQIDRLAARDHCARRKLAPY
jgi:hypothetical protein